jgi:hypothetical protein
MWEIKPLLLLLLSQKDTFILRKTGEESEMAEETEPPTTVRVITETRNLSSPPFIAPEKPCATGNAWKEWLEGIECEFRYFKITDPV